MVPLGSVARIVSGATPKTGVAEYWSGNVPWATPADLTNLDGAYISTTPRTLTEAGVRSCATTVLPANSVLLSSRAPIGHVAINTVPMATNQGFKSLVPNDAVDPKYLFYWLRGNTQYLQSLGNGATFKELSKRTMEQIEIPLPERSEQRRIAAILDHADALRTKRRQIVGRLDALEVARFRQVASDTASRPMPAGVLMPDMRNGVSPSRSGSFTARVLTLSAVTRGSFKASETKLGTFAIEPPHDKRVASTDFLICRGNGNLSLVGAGTYSQDDRVDLVFPDTVIAGTVDPTLIELPYLDMAWRGEDVRSQIERRARTTNGTFKVNQQTLATVTVGVPSLERQREFVSYAMTIRRQRSAAASALAVADELFASLQARAFRGEL